MRASGAFSDRYLDVLGSVYIYNEHRGYTALDRVLEAVRLSHPGDSAFLAAIVKHRADERKHYLMFKRWFELQKRMPLALDRRVGHIDRFIAKAFGCSIDRLDTREVATNPALFDRLLRVIALTERRGLWQVGVLLRNRWVRSDPVLVRMFTIIERDEPDHFLPYERWLETHSRSLPRWTERWTDFWIHRALVLGRIPAIFLDPDLPRMRHWPDEEDRPVS